MFKKRTTSLSKHLDVTRRQLEERDVFDSTLGIDTRLFIDTKLLINSKIPELTKSRESILLYFDKVIRVLKQSSNIKRLQNIAEALLAVKEPTGLSIGYGQKTDDGTAVPKTVAKEMLLSATEMLRVGIEDPEIMELLGLFIKGFGPDRMSDLTAHIIYDDLCKFTERVSAELKIEKITEFEINNNKYKLPHHPFSKHQIIFLPASLLRELPLASSWDEIADAAAFNSERRKEYNDIVYSIFKKNTEKMTKQSAQNLKNSKFNLEKLLRIYKTVPVKPYNLIEDSMGCYNIQPFIEKNEDQIKPSSKPQNIHELIVSIKELLEQFKRNIIDLGGNRLLYRRTKTGELKPWEPHREDVAQTIFYGIADLFCQKANIMLSGESDAGRGPVDFSLGTGYDTKVLVEIKKSDNPNLLNGFMNQITAYAKSENAAYSFYLVIIVKQDDPLKNKGVSQLMKLKKLYSNRVKSKMPTPELFIVDGLIYPSPSKLK